MKNKKKEQIFDNLNIAIKILKARIKRWQLGEQIGFRIKRKHFIIVRDK